MDEGTFSLGLGSRSKTREVSSTHNKMRHAEHVSASLHATTRYAFLHALAKKIKPVTENKADCKFLCSAIF